MAYVLADRVFETSTSTGVGSFNLAGSTSGFRTFVSGVGTGNTCNYEINNGTDWEIGIGTITAGSPDVLARDTVTASSNAGAKVNWGSGTKNVFLPLIASNTVVTAKENTFSANQKIDSIQTTGSGGIALKNSGGTSVLTIGAGSGTGATFAGGVNITGSIAIAGNSTAAAVITLAEDTDNGTNKVTITPPQSIASDYTLTLPSAAGTLARTADIPTVTSWANVTTNPTITNAGTITTQSWKWRRIGDTLYLSGGFVIASNPASELRIGLPDGLTIDHTKIPIVNSNNGIVGNIYWSGNNTGNLIAITDGTNNYMRVGLQNSASGFAAASNTSAFSVGSTIYVDVQIPISGW